MNDSYVISIRVLAIDPTAKGFGFAVLESPEMLVDWGVKEVAGQDKNAQCLKLISTLLNRFSPGVLLTERANVKGSRRCDRVKQLISVIHDTAAQKRIVVRQVSKTEVKSYFSSCAAATKHEIATDIGKRLPELGPRVPRFRHPWMSEDSRMAIFDAVALALTFYQIRAQRKEHKLSVLSINNHVQEEESSRSRH